MAHNLGKQPPLPLADQITISIKYFHVFSHNFIMIEAIILIIHSFFVWKYNFSTFFFRRRIGLWWIVRFPVASIVAFYLWFSDGHKSQFIWSVVNDGAILFIAQVWVSTILVLFFDLFHYLVHLLKRLKITFHL